MSRSERRRSPDLEGFELEADMMRVLANPKRLRIVNALGEGPLTVTDLAEHLGLSLQTTSQHLRLMRDRYIVRAQREGREVRYSLSSPVFPQCCALVRNALVGQARARQHDLALVWDAAEPPGSMAPPPRAKAHAATVAS